MKTAVTKKQLKNLEVEVYENGGFTLWITDTYVCADGKKIKIRHWLIDGSCVKEDGKINISHGIGNYQTGIQFDETNKRITIVNNKIAETTKSKLQKNKPKEIRIK